MLTVVDVQLGFHVKSLSLHNVLNALVYGGRDLLTLQDWLVRSSSKISDLAADGKPTFHSVERLRYPMLLAQKSR
ncbi:MAG: hypothetical protein DMG93_14455 [Acidobacteria bacterium]|nr:MAG: hypothetical protein DMG93_14455 [Acidobacteriota bacterium]